MKRLMFAVAALAAGFAMADGITSANVVGYSAMDTVAADLTWRAMTFENVSGADAEYTLSQINVEGTDFSGWEGDYVATIAQNGAQDQYFSYDPDEKAWFYSDESCEPDFERPANDVALPMNQAIFVASHTGEAMTLAGAVMKGDTELYCVGADLTFTGNFSPASITLGDLVVSGEDLSGWEGDYIATIAPNGAQEQYYSYDPDEKAWFFTDESCEPDFERPANDVVILANQAFILSCHTDVSISVPSPIK